MFRLFRNVYIFDKDNIFDNPHKIIDFIKTTDSDAVIDLNIQEKILLPNQRMVKKSQKSQRGNLLILSMQLNKLLLLQEMNHLKPMNQLKKKRTNTLSSD